MIKKLLIDVSICDNKYRVTQDSAYNLKAYRNGEFWQTLTGDNLVIGLAQEVQDLRDILDATEKRPKQYEIDAYCFGETIKELRKEILVQKERIEQAEKERGGLANFNPDWDMLRATQDSLREHMGIEKELIEKLKKLQALESPCDYQNKYGRLLLKYIDRLSDPVPTDPLDSIVHDLVAEFEVIIATVKYPEKG